MNDIWPPPSHIVLFIAYLYLKGKAHKTVMCYVAVINFRCKVLKPPNLDYSKNVMVCKMLEGLRRARSSKDMRLPITSQLLNKIIDKLPSVCFSLYETWLFAAASSLAFHGFLRVRPIAVNCVFE